MTETEPISGHAVPPDHLALVRRFAVVLEGQQGLEVALLVPEFPLIVGRTEPATLRLEDQTLSREHARFLLSGDRITVQDLGSRNGTWIAGRRVEKAEIELGDEIMLGGVLARVHALSLLGESLGVEGEDRFRRQLEEEAARARQFQRTFGLLVVRGARAQPDQAEPAFTGAHAHGWLEKARSVLRPVDKLSLYGPDAVQILLPEAAEEDALRIAQAITAIPSEQGVHLWVGVALFPDPASTVDELLERSRASANAASWQRPIQISRAEPWLEAGCPEGSELVVGSALREVIEIIHRIAPSRVPVVLHGETGTGKEVLARLIHEHGPRQPKRMVRINCGAIPKDLVESTLFGHERGAFTGAVLQQKGAFEEADHGTIFLDEIGELPVAAQVALLRVLETGSFSRVGSNREIAVDVRIVAATHRDLDAMVQSGTFRADLFYRLNTLVLEIPPLRERTEEIEPLARRFMRLANEANGRSVQGIDPAAIELLKTYAWPGNVRELRNAIERAVVVTRGTTIVLENLPVRVRTRQIEPSSPPPMALAAHVEAPLPAPPSSHEPASVRGQIQSYEAKLIIDALQAAGWNRTQAAKRLGMPVRTLSYRMKVLCIRKE